MHRRRRRTLGRSSVLGPAPTEAGLLVLLGVLTAVAYQPFYAEPTFVVPLAGAAVVAGALAYVLDARAWPVPRIALASVAALTAYAVWTLYPRSTFVGLPVPAALITAGKGLAGGWAQMLTVGIPARPRADLLATPLAATWLATAGSVLLARRTASAWAPLGPPALAFILALALVASDGRDQRLLAATVAGVALAVVRRRRRAAVSLSERRSSPLAAVQVVAVCGVAAIVSTTTPGVDDTRADPRNLWHEEVRLDPAPNPLSRLKEQLNNGDVEPRVLFEVSLSSEADEVDRMGVATLDAYDGVHWTSTEEFRPLAARIGDEPADGSHVVRVEQQVTVRNLSGPFLPAVGGTIDATGDDLAVGVDTGTLVTTRRDLRDLRYEVESGLTRLTDDELALARAGVGGDLDTLRQVPPDVPERLRYAASVWAEGAGNDGAQLVALRDHLLEVPYDDSPRAEPGHSYAAMLRALAGDEADDGRQGGYAEQFASAFTLMARLRGFPARVAVGYLLPAPRPDGTIEVNEGDAHAWPEVNLAGYGWVAVEPTDISMIDAPHDDTPQAPGGSSDAPSEAGRSAGAGVSGLAEGPNPPNPDGDDQPEEPPAPSPLWPVVALGGLVAFAVAVIFRPLVGKALLRRRRRRVPSSRGQVLAAWDETRDRLGEFGVDDEPALTVRELTNRLDRETWGEDVLDNLPGLADLVDRATYSSVGPSELEALQAWQSEKVIVAGARASVGRLRRMRARFGVAALQRERRREGGARRRFVRRRTLLTAQPGDYL